MSQDLELRARRITALLEEHGQMTRTQIHFYSRVGKYYTANQAALDWLIRRGRVVIRDAGWVNGLKYGRTSIVYRVSK